MKITLIGIAVIVLVFVIWDMAWFQRLRHPGYSCCRRCHRPWACVAGHTTYWGVEGGCFPLCARCWSALTPEQRWPYYCELLMDWRARSGQADFNGQPWPEIQERLHRAVMRGE